MTGVPVAVVSAIASENPGSMRLSNHVFSFLTMTIFKLAFCCFYACFYAASFVIAMFINPNFLKVHISARYSTRRARCMV
ncbi:hypothetical protein BDV98DRAFT_571472, partial [Pterulicium gracile]